MKIVAKYDFNGGDAFIKQNYPEEFEQISAIIHAVDSSRCKNKKSKEKTMDGKILYSPVEINNEFRKQFTGAGWRKHKITCEYQHGEYLNGYRPARVSKVKPYREMDFVKEGTMLGIEVQFGKYAFMVYNVCAKMTIFYKLGIINAGVEIVPVKNFADDMSTGVSYFEQFAWDLHYRGISDIDIPVLILGVDS